MNSNEIKAQAALGTLELYCVLYQQDLLMIRSSLEQCQTFIKKFPPIAKDVYVAEYDSENYKFFICKYKLDGNYIARLPGSFSHVDPDALVETWELERTIEYKWVTK